MIINSKSSFASITGNMQEQNTRVKAIKSTDNLIKQSYYVVYIPENLNLKELTQKNPPTFKYDLDCFAYLCNCINDDSNCKNIDFTPLYSEILQGKIRKYRIYLDYLIQHKIIIEDKQYFVGVKSRNFKFSDAFNSKVIPYKLTKKTLVNNIFNSLYPSIEKIEKKRAIYKALNNRNSNNTNPDFFERPNHLEKWFNNNLQVNLIEAKEYLNDLLTQGQNQGGVNPMKKYCSRLISIEKLARREFNFNTDSTSGRLHTNLTTLKSELRNYLNYDNQKLISLDIVNSQPYLSLILTNYDLFEKNNMIKRISEYNKIFSTDLLKQNKLKRLVATCQNNHDVKLYNELIINGKIYEYFGNELINHNPLVDLEGLSLRKYAKKKLFQAFFSKNNSIAFCENIKVFKKCFPTIYQIFLIIKGNKSHRALPCVLQKIEAELILNNVTKQISNFDGNIPLYTIHDSIITIEKYKLLVKNILESELLNLTGKMPNIKEELWAH